MVSEVNETVKHQTQTSISHYVTFGHQAQGLGFFREADLAATDIPYDRLSLRQLHLPLLERPL
jgi:hypothetical protein